MGVKLQLISQSCITLSQFFSCKSVIITLFNTLPPCSGLRACRHDILSDWAKASWASYHLFNNLKVKERVGMVVRCGATSHRQRAAKCHSGRSEMYIVMQNGRFRITLQRYEKSLKPPNIYGQNSPVSACFLAVFFCGSCEERIREQRPDSLTRTTWLLLLKPPYPKRDSGFVFFIYMLSQSRPSANGHSVSNIFSVHSTVAL